MLFTPLHDRVLVRRIEADTKTAGGIIIPDSAQEKPSEGEVIAVGEGTQDRIRQGMQQDIAVAMGNNPVRTGNADTAEHQSGIGAGIGFDAVNVIADPDARRGRHDDHLRVWAR